MKSKTKSIKMVSYNTHIIGIPKYTITRIKIIENKLINIPAFTMSDIFNNFEPKTTAFGGVATGNINAQDAARVVPTRRI